MTGFIISLLATLAFAFGLNYVKSGSLAIGLGFGYASFFAITLMTTPLPTNGWWGFVTSVVGLIVGALLLAIIVDFKKLMVNVSGRITAEKK